MPSSGIVSSIQELFDNIFGLIQRFYGLALFSWTLVNYPVFLFLSSFPFPFLVSKENTLDLSPKYKS